MLGQRKDHETTFHGSWGEYLVGAYIEHTYPQWCVWVPSKDTGIDLLRDGFTKQEGSLTAGQVLQGLEPDSPPHLVQNKLMATGWWTHQDQKIEKSKADFWVFVLPSFIEHETASLLFHQATSSGGFGQFMAERARGNPLVSIGDEDGTLLGDARAAECRYQELIAFDRFSNQSRDFTRFL